MYNSCCDKKDCNKIKDLNSEDVGRRRRSGNPATRWKTPPLTNPFQESPKTSLLFAAQSRAYSSKQLTNSQPSTSKGYTSKFYRTNPFEDISSLEFDKCSPGLFIVHQSSAEKGEFRWSIEDISRIMPAQIESPNSVPEEYFDEETENAAQEAIERYFSFRHAVASPTDAVEALLSPEMNTPPAEILMARAAMGCCTSNSIMGYSGGGRGMTSAISSTPCTRSAAERRLVIKVDESTQTKLSLPPTLPPELEAALRPYILNKDDNFESEECNTSNTTLRRKLFFNKEEVLSPVKADEEGGGINSSPIQGSNNRPSRIEWTPDKKNEQPQLYCLSSPDISPIKFKSNYQFTKDMSIDCSSNNLHDAVNSPQNLIKQANVNLPSPEEKEKYHHVRGIFSSTVKSSQIDRLNKDTGYSTMEVDSTRCTQSHLISNKT